MTTKEKYRMTTHAGRWADLWDRLEECGIPIDTQEAVSWSTRYRSSRAYLLIAQLDRLQDMKLPMEAVTSIASAVVDAFKMGQDFDGRIK